MAPLLNQRLWQCKILECQPKHFLTNKTIPFRPNVRCYTQFEHAQPEQLRQRRKCIALRNKTRFFNFFFSFVKPYYIIKTYKSYNNRELYNTQDL